MWNALKMETFLFKTTLKIRLQSGFTVSKTFKLQSISKPIWTLLIFPQKNQRKRSSLQFNCSKFITLSLRNTLTGTITFDVSTDVVYMFVEVNLYVFDFKTKWSYFNILFTWFISMWAPLTCILEYITININGKMCEYLCCNDSKEAHP